MHPGEAVGHQTVRFASANGERQLTRSVNTAPIMTDKAATAATEVLSTALCRAEYATCDTTGFCLAV